MIYNTNKCNRLKFIFSMYHFMGAQKRVVFAPFPPFQCEIMYNTTCKNFCSIEEETSTIDIRVVLERRVACSRYLYYCVRYDIIMYFRY